MARGVGGAVGARAARRLSPRVAATPVRVTTSGGRAQEVRYHLAWSSEDGARVMHAVLQWRHLEAGAEWVTMPRTLCDREVVDECHGVPSADRDEFCLALFAAEGRGSPTLPALDVRGSAPGPAEDAAPARGARVAYYEAERVTLYRGECMEVMAGLPECSVDAVVTDPPYGLGFMGKEWDNFAASKVGGEHRFAGIDLKKTSQRSTSMHAGLYELSLTGNQKFQAWCEGWAREALRVLKPGGHLLAFGGPRTYHRLVSGLEDAGFEVRDCLVWLFGSGFPKSAQPLAGMYSLPRSTSKAAWRAFHTRARAMRGTALKPGYEPIALCRKPLRGTVAGNVLAYGTGALNIDGCRLEGVERPLMVRTATKVAATAMAGVSTGATSTGELTTRGRWPANVVLDEEAARLLDAQGGAYGAHSGRDGTELSDGFGGPVYGTGKGPRAFVSYGDRGGASRFFYTAKTGRAEREAGLEELAPARRSDGRAKDIENPRLRTNERRNDHPTVKPVELMRWLVRLVTPPGGVVLDPFMGSGSTGMAALDEGFRFVGVDREERYCEIARRRIAHRHLHAAGPRAPSAERLQGGLL